MSFYNSNVLGKGVIYALAALSMVVVSLAPATAKPEKKPEELPLGKPGLKETRTTEQVAPGVTYTRITRGEESRKDFYTVDVAFKADRAAARDVAEELKSDGYKPRVVRVSERAPDDPVDGPLGYLVRTGSFNTETEANALKTRLAADGYTGTRVIYTGEDGGGTTGPWVVHVLKVDPDLYDGTLAPELATEIVPGHERLTSISARTGSLAAINGGYFVIGSNDGTPGDLAGISVLEGELVSEAVDGRTNLVLPEGDGEGADVATLSDDLSATSSDGASREVDGLNRKPGLIRGCGGEGDQPTERPLHDFTCTDGGELIQFTPIFGASTEPGDGVEAVLDASGRVTELREGRGGEIPPDGSVLSGTGDGADWLRAHARPGATVDVETNVSADGGAPLAGETGVVNGGPRLLSAGEPDITAYAEGFVHPDNPEFYYRFGVRRNPRTLAGVTPGGDLLLVAVDGRGPGYSVGASFEEEAGIMKALGAEEAVNLDGGGSTTMTLDERLVTRPSDTTGERPIADAVVLLPPSGSRKN